MRLRKPKPKKERFVVTAQQHHEWHKKLQEGTITIQNLLDIGVGRSNAYQIRKHDCTIGQSNAGRPTFLRPKERAALVLHARWHRDESIELLAIWARERFKKPVTASHVRRALANYGFKPHLQKASLTEQQCDIDDREEQKTEAE